MHSLSKTYTRFQKSRSHSGSPLLAASLAQTLVGDGAGLVDLCGNPVGLVANLDGKSVLSSRVERAGHLKSKMMAGARRHELEPLQGRGPPSNAALIDVCGVEVEASDATDLRRPGGRVRVQAEFRR